MDRRAVLDKKSGGPPERPKFAPRWPSIFAAAKAEGLFVKQVAAILNHEGRGIDGHDVPPSRLEVAGGGSSPPMHGSDPDSRVQSVRHITLEAEPEVVGTWQVSMRRPAVLLRHTAADLPSLVTASASAAWQLS